eukprot:6150816-Pyramimonas_sp.AAC.1
MLKWVDNRFIVLYRRASQREYSNWLSAGVPRLGTGVPQLGAGVPRLGAGVPRLGAGVPRLSAGVPRLGAGVPRLGAGVPRLGAGVPRLGAGVPRLGAETADGWLQARACGGGRLCGQHRRLDGALDQRQMALHTAPRRPARL